MSVFHQNLQRGIEGLLPSDDTLMSSLKSVLSPILVPRELSQVVTFLVPRGPQVGVRTDIVQEEPLGLMFDHDLGHFLDNQT